MKAYRRKPGIIQNYRVGSPAHAGLTRHFMLLAHNYRAAMT
jgi:hypothetical protein